MTTKKSASVGPEQLLEEGKKHLAAGNASEAVESFQEACGILAEEYGQVAPELSEPYFLYGKALLELARSQNSVLGSGIPVPDERVDSSGDEAVNEDVPQSSTANRASTAEETTPESIATDEAKQRDGSESTAPNEGEEDNSDLKLAWEVLELARIICQKQGSEEYKLKLSDVQLVLAEVSLESDQGEQAIADLNASLQIRELFLEPNDRRLAEVQFSLGLAHVLSKQPDLAIKHFTSAKKVLCKRKEGLERELVGGFNNDKKTRLQQEVSEIKSLIPDIEVKISDTKEMKKIMEAKETQTEECAALDPINSKEGSKASIENKQPTDISHLIRKRVSERESGNQPKKQRTDQENGVTSVPTEQ